MKAVNRLYHPQVEVLESRLQPGSLLPGVLDTALMAGSLNLQEPSPPVLQRRSMGAVGESPAGAVQATAPGPGAPGGTLLTPAFRALDHQAEDLVRSTAPAIQDAMPPDRQSSGPLDQSDADSVSAEPLNQNQPPPDNYERVVNGDFEMGDFTGWRIRGDRRAATVTNSPIDPSSGNYAAEFSAGHSFGAAVTMIQGVVTGGTPDAMFDFGFEMYNGSSQNQITIKWGNHIVFSEKDVAPHDYEYDWMLLTAHAPVTRVTIEIRAVGVGKAGVAIDNVDVHPC